MRDGNASGHCAERAFPGPPQLRRRKVAEYSRVGDSVQGTYANEMIALLRMGLPGRNPRARNIAVGEPLNTRSGAFLADTTDSDIPYPGQDRAASAGLKTGLARRPGHDGQGRSGGRPVCTRAIRSER
jgi:hypothetical protein